MFLQRVSVRGIAPHRGVHNSRLQQKKETQEQVPESP